jgi:acetolactate synthase-1/2/3 large subunit
MRASDMIIKCLESEGVERIFGIPGEENMEVMDSLIDSNIEFILTKHENSAAFMAGACARLTGKPHVCLATLGPGATNMVTGVAEAYLSHIPLIAITGQVGADQAYAPRKQFLDLVALYKPVTKESFSMRTAARIPVQVRRAFDIAASEKQGPVHIELPEDVMKAETEGEPLKRAERETMKFQRGTLDKVRTLLEKSETPIVFVGPGVIRLGAVRVFRALVEAWNLPVVHSWHGSGIISYDDPLSLNTVGARTRDTVRKAFEEADLILLVGYDLPEFPPTFWNIGKKKNVVVLDAVPAEHVPNFEPDIQVIGNIINILTSLTHKAKKKRPWAKGHKEWLEDCLGHCPDDKFPLKPQLIVKAVRESLGKEDICVSDVGAHLLWLAKLYPVYKENTLLLTNGLIPMGISVPAAIGAKLTKPDKKVVAVCGDGGFAMCGPELETARRLGTNFVTVIFNDGGLGLIRYKNQKMYGRSNGTEFGSIDHSKFAESLGAKGYRVSSASELSEVLKGCLKDDELAVIDCPVDYTENRDLL